MIKVPLMTPSIRPSNKLSRIYNKSIKKLWSKFIKNKIKQDQHKQLRPKKRVIILDKPGIMKETEIMTRKEKDKKIIRKDQKNLTKIDKKKKNQKIKKNQCQIVIQMTLLQNLKNQIEETKARKIGRESVALKEIARKAKREMIGTETEKRKIEKTKNKRKNPRK